MEIEMRLSLLERSARRWRAVGAAALVLLGAAVALLAVKQRANEHAGAESPGVPSGVLPDAFKASTITADRVRATSFDIVAKDGEPCGTLGSGTGHGAHLILGQNGQGQILLDVHDDHRIEVILVAAKGWERMKLALDAEGAPQLSLQSETSPEPVKLAVGLRGEGFLTLRDRSGNLKVLGPDK